MKKVLAMLLMLALVFSLAGCGGGTEDENGDAAGASVYFLNFKPEIADAYAEVAAAYEAETGVKVKIKTAASGEYEQTLMAEMAKTDAPTIFQINGPVGYANWKDYCADLSDTELYGWLNDPGLAVTGEDGGVYGIPYTVEGYGIIYNDAIMQKYFAMDGAKAASMDEIDNFAMLKAVAEDMTAKKDELGIKGVFASTSMLEGNQWRWQTHLANIPLYYEFMDLDAENPVQAGLDAAAIDVTYNENYKNIVDLYLDNSVTAKGLVAGKSVDDSMAEFALGQCAMVQNGNWAWSQISGTDGNVVAAEDIKYIPIYSGVAGEEKKGLCVGTENYLSINSKASAESQEASVKFIEWLFNSDTGKEFVLNDLGFMAPFSTFGEDETPSDPLATQVLEWMNKDGYSSVVWIFPAFPSEHFKDVFGAALLDYIQGAQDWNYVVETVKTSWADERQ